MLIIESVLNAICCSFMIKMGVRSLLISLGAVWLVVVLGIVIFGLCNVQCSPWAKCGCALSDLFCFILVLGIPSWILLVISLGVGDEESYLKSKKKRFGRNS